MSRYRLYILINGLLCFILVVKATAQEYEHPIIEARVFSLDFFTLVPFIDSTESNADRIKSKSYEQLPFTDRKLLSLIHNRLLLLSDTMPPNKNYDVRLILLLARETGNVDTLAFGYDGGYGPASMILNDKFYQLDEMLLREITSFLPPNHQSGIYHYLDTWLPDREKRRHEPRIEPEGR